MTYPEGQWEALVLAGFAATAAYAGVVASYVASDGTVKQPRVMFTEPTESVGDGMQLSDEYAIEFDPADLPGLRKGSTLQIKEQRFTVRVVRKVEDGFTLMASLKQG